GEGVPTTDGNKADRANSAGWAISSITKELLGPPDENMNWEEDNLEYGYVLDRIEGGGWWHLHFGRSNWSYLCDLLGRPTDILTCVQQFAVGALALSPRFLLTLDGEGVKLPEEDAGLDCRWGDHTDSPEPSAAALHI